MGKYHNDEVVIQALAELDKSQTNYARLKKLIDATLFSESDYHRTRLILRNVNSKPIKRAWAFWFNINTSYNSKLYAGQGCGKTNNHAKKFQARKVNMTLELSQRLEHTVIHKRDAIDCLSLYNSADCFAFIDPPYYNSNMGHYGGYTLEDFDKLLEFLSGYKGKFLLTTYNSEILDKYISMNNWSKIELKLQNSALKSNHGKRKKIEVITMNYDLPQSELFV